MNEFITLARKFFNGDFADAAKRLLVALHVPKPAVQILLPIVANAVRLVVREAARDAEREAFRDGSGGLEIEAAFEKLVGEAFYLPDGRMVTWGSATVADHLARIEYLEHLRGGLTATIARHRTTVERLTAAGASCLDALQHPEPKKGKTGRSGHRISETHSGSADRPVAP